MAKNTKLISSSIAAVVAIGAAVYVGAKLYKEINDLNFDDLDWLGTDDVPAGYEEWLKETKVATR